MSYVSTLIGNLSAANQQAHARKAIVAAAVETLEGRQLLSTVSISSPSVNEGGNLVYNVTLNAPSTNAVTVNYALTGGTAKVNTNYTTIKPGKLTFAAGETTKTITVKTKDDKVFSSAKKTVTVRLVTPSAGNTIKGAGIGTGTIINTDLAPVITISNAATTEGASGLKVLTFTVKMTGSTADAPVKVTYATANSSASSATDYVAAKGTLSFTKLNAPQTIKVSIRGDKTAEANEAFLVNLSGAGFTVVNPLVAGAKFAVGSIKNDDGGSVSANTTVAATNAIVNPGTSAGLTLSLNHISADPVTVVYNTANGTAVAGTDYTATSSSVTFNPGETSKTIAVPTSSTSLGGTFTVNLAAATNATVASSPTVTITTTALPGLSVSDVSIVEGNAGTKNAVVTVSLASVAAQTITVGYATANGTATAGSDYTAVSGTLTFPAGTTSKTISIPIIGDSTAEPDETFTVNLGAPVNAPITKTFGTVTITNDDADPTAGPNDGLGLAFDQAVTGFSFNNTLGSTTNQQASFNYTINSTRATPLNNLQIQFFIVPNGTNLATATPYRTDTIGTINAGQTVTASVDARGSQVPVSGDRYYARLVLNGVAYDTVLGPPTF